MIVGRPFLNCQSDQQVNKSWNIPDQREDYDGA